jgi:hypothetical protein
MTLTSIKTLLVLASVIALPGYSQKPVETEFKPFTHTLTIEELRDDHSGPFLDMAAADMAILDSVNRTGIYQGTLESIDKHPTPEWYRDAKLCIFYDWGPYSLAGYGEKEWSRARYPDWYLNHMYHWHADYHKENWGEDFHRDDFIPLFNA